MNIYDKLYPTTSKYKWTWTFTKTGLTELEVTHSMFSDHYRITLEININDIFKMLNSLK